LSPHTTELSLLDPELRPDLGIVAAHLMQREQVDGVERTFGCSEETLGEVNVMHAQPVESWCLPRS